MFALNSIQVKRLTEFERRMRIDHGTLSKIDTEMSIHSFIPPLTKSTYLQLQ